MLRAFGMLVIITLCSSTVHAQQGAEGTFPSKPIRMVLPVTAGGVADIASRHLGNYLQGETGWAVVVDPQPGAGGTIAARAVARADADGHTLLFAVSSFSISPALLKNIGYDPLHDFVPVACLFESPIVLIARPNLGPRNLRELVALAKAQPGRLNLAVSGNGTLVHLATESLRRMAQIDFVQVTYRGQAPGLTDLLGGKVDAMFAEPSVMRYVADGKLVALATSGEKRMPQYPQLATVSESGVPGFRSGAWFGILAPAKTPRVVIEKLNGAVNAGLQTSAIKEFAAKFGFEPVGGPPQRLGERIRDELTANAKLIAEAGIKAQ